MIALVLVLSTSAYARECTELRCIAASPDDNGVCEVSVELLHGDGLAMMQFAMVYAPEKMECIGAEVGSLLASDIEPTINTTIPGEIYFVWDTLSPLEGDGQVLTLQMRLLEGKPVDLAFNMEEDFLFAYEDFTEIEVLGIGCVVGATMEEIQEALPDVSLAESDANSQKVIAIGAGTVFIVAAVFLVLFFGRKRPKGKHEV